MAFVADDSLVRIYHREAKEVLTYSLPEFTRNCMHNTALGKAYLASLPEDIMLEKIKTLELVARTAKTITDKEIFLKEIKATKKRGYALQVEEYLPGVLAIAAPLYDPLHGRAVGAVSFDFSVLQHDIKGVVSQFGEMIQQTAKELSELLPQGLESR